MEFNFNMFGVFRLIILLLLIFKLELGPKEWNNSRGKSDCGCSGSTSKHAELFDVLT